jgi:hypothetical protein
MLAAKDVKRSLYVESCFHKQCFSRVRNLVMTIQSYSWTTDFAIKTNSTITSLTSELNFFSNFAKIFLVEKKLRLQSDGGVTHDLKGLFTRNTNFASDKTNFCCKTSRSSWRQ